MLASDRPSRDEIGQEGQVQPVERLARYADDAACPIGIARGVLSRCRRSRLVTPASPRHVVMFGDTGQREVPSILASNLKVTGNAHIGANRAPVATLKLSVRLLH